MRKIEDDALFQAKGGFHLTTGDQEVLSMLYLPVLSTDAFSLYFLLLSMSENGDENSSFCQKHDVLTRRLSVNETSLLKAIEQLEALSLLKTYRKESSRDGVTSVEYIYRVLPPLSGKAFLSDPQMNALLSQTLDDGKEMLSLERKFNKADDKFIGFAEISAHFEDVYTVETDGQISKNDLSEAPKYVFDVDALKKEIKDKGVKLRSVSKYIDQIVTLSKAYQINEATAADVVFESMDTSKSEFYIADFEDKIKKFNNYKAEPVSSKTGRKNITNKSLKLMNEMSPIDFATVRLNNRPTSLVTDEIKKLMEEYGLSNPLINICIDYSLKMTKNQFNTSYIEKVALSLKANNIETIEEAAQYLSKTERSASKAKAKKSGGIKKEKVETDVDDDVLEDSGL